MDAPADRTPTRLGLDHEGKFAEVELASGLVVASALTGRAATHEGEIARTDYSPERGEQVITFRSGEQAVFEIGPSRRPDVPVVYLDQNKWVMLARLQWSPDKVPEDQHEAYARLTELARERQIILPLSSAHAFEAARKDGRQRRQLATTMLQLARGWQMRSPLKIRREEILHNLSESCDGSPGFRRRPAFTLDPHALFSTSDHADAQSPREDLKARTTWASALAEVMIEDEREDEEVARSKAERWARHHAAIAARMAGASREEKWASAQAAVLADLRDEMAAAAATARLDREVWEGWLAGSEAHFASMPAISRVQQITFRRLSNAQYPWRVNDLSDMHFLSSAAGYGDYLLAENATSHDLRGAERQVPPGARICRTPGELVDLLEGQGGLE